MHIYIDLCMRKSKNYERMDGKKGKKRTQQQTLWKRKKREKNTIYTQHLALNVSSLSLLMVGYIIGVCLPYTKQIHVFCFYACACVLVAAMFILLVCIFSFTHQRLNVKTQQQQQHFNMHSMFKGESLQRLWIAHKQQQQQVSPVTYRDLVLPTPMFMERSFQQFVFVLFLTCLACWFRYNTKIQIQTTFHVAVTQSPAARERIKIFGLDEHLKCHAKHGHKHQHTNSALSCLAKCLCRCTFCRQIQLEWKRTKSNCLSVRFHLMLMPKHIWPKIIRKTTESSQHFKRWHSLFD